MLSILTVPFTGLSREDDLLTATDISAESRSNSASRHIWMRVAWQLTRRWPPNALRSKRWTVCERDIIQKAVTRGFEEHPHKRRPGMCGCSSCLLLGRLVSLKRVSGIQTGLTLGKVYEGPLIERPYLRVANVQDGHLELQDVTTIEVPDEVAHRVELRPGDVLMTEGGDLDKLGRGTIWSGEIPDCLHQNHIFAIRCFKHKLLPAFLAYLTASRYGRDYFEATGKRTTNLASTNSRKVGLFPIPRPSIEEQDAICRYLDEKLNHISHIVFGIESQIATLTAYRKLLIHECVTGQRRITERALHQI